MVGSMDRRSYREWTCGVLVLASPDMNGSSRRDARPIFKTLNVESCDGLPEADRGRR